MPAYTLEITNGVTTYTFGSSSRPAPDWEPDLAYEHNEEQSPAVVTAEIETWTLRDFVYVDGTPSTLTSDLETLAALLRNRASPVTSCKLKWNGSTARELNTTTHAQLMVRALRTRSGPGSWVNHWRGDLVIVARRALHASNIVRLDQRLRLSYDAAGLLTETLTGRVEVTPGTDVEAAAQAYALTSRGSAFVFTTGGAAGGAANIDIEITNRPTNTIAEFTSQQVERGTNVPATATDWAQGAAVADTSGGRITTHRVTARGTSAANALAAVRTAKPGTGVQVTTERTDHDTLTVTAEYVVREPLPEQAQALGLATLVSCIRRVTVQGGGQPRILEPVPGYDPYTTYGARQPVRVVERVTARYTNVTDVAGVRLPEHVLALEHLQPAACEDDLPAIEEKAEQAAADLWSRSATRVYELVDVTALDFPALFAKLRGPFTFSAEPDYAARGLRSI